jgi:hypothetical protein
MKKVVLRSDLLKVLTAQTNKSIIRAAPESWDEEPHVLAYVDTARGKKKGKSKAKKAAGQARGRKKKRRTRKGG